MPHSYVNVIPPLLNKKSYPLINLRPTWMKKKGPGGGGTSVDRSELSVRGDSESDAFRIIFFKKLVCVYVMRNVLVEKRPRLQPPSVTSRRRTHPVSLR